MVDRSPPYCRICEGVEGTSLPTDCPGEKLTSAQVSGVHFKTLDYRDGRWDDPAVFDWKPAAMPTASNFGGPSIVVTGDDGSTTVSGSGGSRHITTIIPTEPVDEPEENGGAPSLIPVPIPIPIPIPIPSPTGGSSGPAEEEEGDPSYDVRVNK
jgi:hypothetical protein